jgi:arylsulfatase A-like enzyme
MDLFATILDAAAIELDCDTLHRIFSPGRSILTVVDDPAASWRRYRFAEHGNARLVANERWKLIRRTPPLDPRFGDELYDLETDPRETTNLIGDPDHAGEAARLGQALDTYFGRYEDPEKSGSRVMELPPANGREPWRRMAERLSPPE